MMTQTLIPEGPSPWSKAIAASFVLLSSKDRRRVTRYAHVDLPARRVPSCLCCITVGLPSAEN